MLGALQVSVNIHPLAGAAKSNQEVGVDLSLTLQTFAVYLADDASGTNEVFVASTASGNAGLTIPAGTLADGRSYAAQFFHGVGV